MKVKFKKSCEEAVAPFYAYESSAGLDLTATSRTMDEYGNIVYGTGIQIEIPKGYVGLLYTRSSNHKKKLDFTCCVGVIDSDYRGEITMKYRPSTTFIYFSSIWKRLSSLFFGAPKGDCNLKTAFCIKDDDIYEVGDRIGQLIIMSYPKIELVPVRELSQSARGENGYGSSGK